MEDLKPPAETTAADAPDAKASHPVHSILQDMENEINALGSYALTILRPYLDKIRNAL